MAGWRHQVESVLWEKSADWTWATKNMQITVMLHIPLSNECLGWSGGRLPVKTTTNCAVLSKYVPRLAGIPARLLATCIKGSGAIMQSGVGSFLSLISGPSPNLQTVGHNQFWREESKRASRCENPTLLLAYLGQSSSTLPNVGSPGPSHQYRNTVNT